jgi:hypothetical protein
MGNKHALGRNPSLEIRAKISATLTGRKLRPEHRANLSAANRSMSPEHIAKLRAINTGNTYGFGHKHSSEARAKMSAAVKQHMRQITKED